MIDNYRKSYEWSDTVRTFQNNDTTDTQRILTIDSTYSLNKRTLQEIEYCFYTNTKIFNAPLLPEIKVTLFYRNGRVVKKQIWNHASSRQFEESNGNFYERDTSLPLGYSEWNEISRSYFGEAMRDALIAKDFSLAKAAERDKNVLNHKILF
jgi:hypothetical protein